MGDFMWVSINGGSPRAGWFVRENPTKMDDLGVPDFQETPIYTNQYGGEYHKIPKLMILMMSSGNTLTKSNQ